jgi:predicted lipoprotein with Yx(FWY)xxD motif
MMHTRRTLPIILAIFIAITVAACGSSTSSGSSASGGSTSTPAPVATTPASPSPTPSPTSSGSTSSPLVKTMSVTISGKSETILTDASGKSLYYFTPDTATTSACTGACAQTWPPLLSTGSGAPTSASTLPGKLTVLTTGNGSQVAYNGHLLYTFSGDSAAGDTKGQGLFGKWFVATPGLK